MKYCQHGQAATREPDGIIMQVPTNQPTPCPVAIIIVSVKRPMSALRHYPVTQAFRCLALPWNFLVLSFLPRWSLPVLFFFGAYGWPLNIFGAQDAFGLNPSSLQIRRLSSKSGFPACHQGIIVGTVRFVMVVVVGLATLIDKIGFPSPGPSFGAAVCHGHRSSSHSNPWLPLKSSPPLLSPALARAHGA